MPRSSQLAGPSDHVLGGVGESDLVVTHHVATQHPEHFRTGTLDDGNACKQSRPQVKRQDRLCRGRQVHLFCGNDMVEVGNDCTEHPVAPKLMLARKGPDHSPHQEKPGDFGWRCPRSDATFGFIVEQLFAAQCRNAILREGGGEFAPVFSSKQVTAQRTCDAPSQQLASQDRRRSQATRAAARAELRWSRGEEPMRRLRHIDEGHSTQDGRLLAKLKPQPGLHPFGRPSLTREEAKGMFGVVSRCIDYRRQLRRRWQDDARRLLVTEETNAYYEAQRRATRARMRGDKAEFSHWAKVAAEAACISPQVKMDMAVLKQVVAEEERRSG